MNPEDRLRALNDSDRWTVNAIQPRENPFGSVAPARRRQSWRMIFAEIGVVAVVGAVIFGAITIQNRTSPDISENPTPVPTSTPIPTPEVTQPPVPSNTPEPPPVNAPTVSKIVISSAGVELRSESEKVLNHFEYLEEDTDALVAALKDVLGNEPALSHDDGDSMAFPSEKFDWGGFIVADYEGDADSTRQAFQVEVWASEVNNVTIVTDDGVGIGTPVSRVQTLSDALGDTQGFENQLEGVWYLDRIPANGTDEPTNSNELPVYTTVISADNDSTVVTRILAPGRIFGP